MPELPWSKFFYNDWRGDVQLGRCSTSTRGIWIDAITAMMASKTDRISGSDDQLAKDCRCSVPEIQAAHEELKSTKTADVSMQNGCKIWICRRLSRELNLSKIRSESASKRWSKGDARAYAKPMQDADASSASASASASASVQEGECEGEGQERHFPEVATPSWEEFWSYCQHIGLAAEWYAKDKHLAAEQEHWKRQPNWHAYAARCKAWWESDGRPMTKADRNGKSAIRPDIALREIEKMIAEHPCNPKSLSYGTVKITTEKKADYANKLDRRRLLRLQVGGVA